MKRTGRDFLMDLLFPRRCPFCGKVTGSALLCQKCGGALPYTGHRSVVEGSYGRCASPLYYEKEAREAVLAFKFGGRLGGVDCFARLLADCAAEAFSGQFDTVTWVPVSPQRRRQRGFDQSWELCRALGRHYGLVPVETLRKTLDAPAQSSLGGAAERRANVLGAYEPVPENIWGKRILLVDDILTTGATMGECARVLRENGAAEVVCLTLCRTK